MQLLVTSLCPDICEQPVRQTTLESRRESAIEEKSDLLKNIETADRLSIKPIPYHSSRLIEAERKSPMKEACEGQKEKVSCTEILTRCGGPCHRQEPPFCGMNRDVF